MPTDLRTRLLQSDLRDLIAPDLVAHPYPAYEQLRGDPVRMRSGTAVVTGYADGATVLRDEPFVRETMPQVPGRTMRTMADMLIPPEHTRLRNAATTVVQPDSMAGVERCARELTQDVLRSVRYAEHVIQRSDDRGASGFVPSLRALVANETITDREAASIWLQVLVAGFDTVQTMLTSAIWLLGEHPEQCELLANDPTLLSAAIEEVLRFESPTRLFGRVVGEDTVLSLDDPGRRCPECLDEGAAGARRFRAGELRAEAEVDPVAGRAVLAAACASDVEAVRIREDIGVSVGGAEDDHDVGAALQLEPAEWRRSYFFRGLDHVGLRL